MAKDNKTSKTARVMNLLSKKPDPAAASEETAGTADAPAAPVPPIVTSMAPDANLSVQIKNALEGALESELGGQPPIQEEPDPKPIQQPASQPAPIEEQSAPAPRPEPDPVEEKPAPASQPDPDPVEERPAPAPQPDPKPEDESKFQELLKPMNPGYINVMQVLVEEKAPKYIQMFGLCTCDRCLEDVKAFTLNHLPPKYVVLEPGERIPRLTVYEGKFSSDITAQLLQACKVVMERPHHGRK